MLLGRKASSAVLQNSSFLSPEHEILLFTSEHQVEFLEIKLNKLHDPPMTLSTWIFFNSYLSTSCLQHFVSYNSDGPPSALVHSEPALPVSCNSVHLPVFSLGDNRLPWDLTTLLSLKGMLGFFLQYWFLEVRTER